MKEIPLSRGLVALVDDADFERLSHFNWYAEPCRDKFRAARGDVGTPKPNRRPVSMHREIMGAKSGQQVDHINGNQLDNRRCNLRICNNAENNRNKSKYSTNTTGYKCVRKRGARWIAYIVKNARQLYLGSFDTAEQAARKYDEAARLLHGKFAHLNFPDHG